MGPFLARKSFLIPLFSPFSTLLLVKACAWDDLGQPQYTKVMAVTKECNLKTGTVGITGGKAKKVFFRNLVLGFLWRPSIVTAKLTGNKL